MIAMISANFNALISGTLDPYWPHFWLLLFSFIAEIIVAIGIVLEVNWPLTHRQIIATALVVGGVLFGIMFTLGLFVFDEGISSAQQTKIIVLETRLAPRFLTFRQQTSIADTLRTYSGIKFEIVTYQENTEPYALAKELSSTLQDANWHMETLDASLLSGLTGVQIFTESTLMPSGMHVSSADSEMAKRAADALATSLRENGIPIPPIQDGGTAETGATVRIVIGWKP